MSDNVVNPQSSSRDKNEHSQVTPKKIFSLAVPALGVLAATPLYLLYDTAVVGRLGSFELAALSAGTTIQSTVTTQLTFLSYGTTARSSRLFGQGKIKEAVAEGVQATWVAVGVGLTLLAIMLFGAPRFALWLTGNEGVAAEASSWMRVSAFAIPPTLMIMAGNGWMRGIQNTRAPLIFTLCGMLPMIVLVPLLVNHFGFVGSAYANVIGMGIICVGFLGALLRRHEGSWAPKGKVIWSQLIMGRDLIVRSLSFQIAFLSAAAVAARFGTASLAAHQIMIQVWNFITLVLDSLAIAAQTLTGAALGGGTVALARAVGKKVVQYSLGFAAILGALFALGNSTLPRLFTPDESVLEAIHGPWWLMIAMIIMGGVVFALDGVLLGASDAAFLRTISIGAVIFGFLPGVWISYLVDGGLVGVWCGLVAFIALRLGAVIWRFRSMRWARV
ncbi:MATE family efflux transporter [Corynebacterium renale]|uniref:MATE family efflux transporter n=1 Tax=Corynebacterium renale TaxID=1724 RepID=UPI000E03A6F5|nr:MATE family efflux transporter [Corynebacterium renale]STC96540.1 DNA-damage-inducible membrane protein [Corynebacterium renale]